jgi:CPA2 family monovalent cation:H+ antiporter-2
MLVDIHAIFSNLGLVVLISAVTIVGKILSTTAGLRFAKIDRKTSIQAGLCLGQIGEFSFIIATLGLSLHVIRPELYPLAVSVALITTFCTPYLIRFSMRSKFLNNINGNHSKKTHSDLLSGHLVELEVHPHFLFVGQSLEELQLREKFGVTAVSIARGERKILAPDRKEIVMPYDRLIVLGTDEELSHLESFLKTQRHDLKIADESHFDLEKILIRSGDDLEGKNLKESGIREQIEGIVLGLERSGEKILNPDSSLRIQAGDVLWVYAKRERLHEWNFL